MTTTPLAPKTAPAVFDFTLSQRGQESGWNLFFLVIIRKPMLKFPVLGKFAAYVDLTDHHIHTDYHAVRREREIIYEAFIWADIWRTVQSSLSLAALCMHTALTPCTLPW